MFAETGSDLILHNVPTESPALNVRADESPLTRLLVGLDGCTRYEDEILLFLDVVQQATSADVAFWYRSGPGASSKIISRDKLHEPWCCETARRLVQKSRNLPPCPVTGLAPASAALVRISKRKGAWVVALGMDPDEPLDHRDVQNIMLARRMLRNHRRQSALFENLRNTLFSFIQGLTKALEAKDPYTCGHSERVARIAVRIAQKMGLSEQEVGDIYLAGLLHDIGKIGIRDEVLAKPGPLTEAEYLHVQQHPIIGDRILSGIAQLEHLIPAVRGHHERIDGNGYPDGLSGDDLHLMARILAVADACDAMMSPRPYRPSLPAGAIVHIMRQGAGTQWDAQVVDVFLQCSEQLFGISEKGIGDSVYAALDRHLDQPSVQWQNLRRR